MGKLVTVNSYLAAITDTHYYGYPLLWTPTITDIHYGYSQLWTPTMMDRSYIPRPKLQTPVVTDVITIITICSSVIGLKNSNFPLILLPSCYRIVCYLLSDSSISQSHSKLRACVRACVQSCSYVRACAFVFLAPNCRRKRGGLRIFSSPL